MSPFLFSLYLNDLETFFLENNISDLEQISKKCQDTIACYLKTFIILYADDTVILSESAESLQEAISAFEEYCNICKNNENRKGDIFSPCFTPTSLLKIQNILLLFVYMF
jgi:uroporphyrinogen-III decarboxylase